ncbi:hypothetical protein RvY_00362 [Ramazzottius varieornatus]|uniref:Uncharacterized protein n=1 Tax=Ramazzottius varieornatus TaxID=947166 RepID=A0A1D1UIU0_RAMVA|nr:hypothetical protein RvY_00362 [Ramazzottius varieornatus]
MDYSNSGDFLKYLTGKVEYAEDPVYMVQIIHAASLLKNVSTWTRVEVKFLASQLMQNEDSGLVLLSSTRKGIIRVIKFRIESQ